MLSLIICLITFNLVTTNIPNPSPIPKLPFNDMLTEFDFSRSYVCLIIHWKIAFLNDDVKQGQCQINFRTFRSQCKGDVFNILPKSPTFAKCLLIFRSCIPASFSYFFTTITYQNKAFRKTHNFTKNTCSSDWVELLFEGQYLRSPDGNKTGEIPWDQTTHILVDFLASWRIP